MATCSTACRGLHPEINGEIICAEIAGIGAKGDVGVVAVKIEGVARNAIGIIHVAIDCAVIRALRCPKRSIRRPNNPEVPDLR